MFLNIYTIAGANKIYGTQDIYYIMLQVSQSYSKENIFIVDIAIYKIVAVIKEQIIFNKGKKKNYCHKQFVLIF